MDRAKKPPRWRQLVKARRNSREHYEAEKTARILATVARIEAARAAGVIVHTKRGYQYHPEIDFWFLDKNGQEAFLGEATRTAISAAHAAGRATTHSDEVGRIYRLYPGGNREFYYPAVLSCAADGVTVVFPDLPGCISCAANEDQALARAAEALTLYLKCSRQGGDTIPLPSPMTVIRPGPKELVKLVIPSD